MTDIESLLSGISPEDMAKLQNIAASLLSEKPQSEKPKNDIKQDENPFMSMENLKPIMSAIGKMNENDDRVRLLMHLKPLLGSDRQKRADEAIKFLHIMQILPELRGLL